MGMKYSAMQQASLHLCYDTHSVPAILHLLMLIQNTAGSSTTPIYLNWETNCIG